MDFKFDFDIPGHSPEGSSGPKDEPSVAILAGQPLQPFGLVCMKDILEDCSRRSKNASDEIQEFRLQSKHLPLFWLVQQSPSVDSSDESNPNSNDLMPNIYEGGFKVWECTVDVVEFLDKSPIQTDHPASLRGKKVLDLGCGVGILGFYSLRRGAQKVCFQDYNAEVITQTTVPSILYNAKQLSDSCDNRDVPHHLSGIDPSSMADKLCFCYGDWSHLKKGFSQLGKFETFDLILTAETIYSESCYNKLHDVLDSFLAPGGVILLAAKSHYFGVGGGVDSWCDFVKLRGTFEVNTVYEVKDSLLRVILQMRRL